MSISHKKNYSLILIMFSLWLFSISSGAAENALKEKIAFSKSDWSPSDTRREALFLTLVIVDWYQTSYAMKKSEHFREGNPVYGERPSQGKINAIMALGAIGQFGVSYFLPPKWRKVFQNTTIGLQGFIVASNYFTLQQDF